MKLATFTERDIKTLHGRRAFCILVLVPAYTGCLKVQPVLLPQVEGQNEGGEDSSRAPQASERYL